MPGHRVVIGNSLVGEVDVTLCRLHVASTQCELRKIEVRVRNRLAQGTDCQIERARTFLLCSAVLPEGAEQPRFEVRDYGQEPMTDFARTDRRVAHRIET